jgi:hypothetical protein
MERRSQQAFPAYAIPGTISALCVRMNVQEAPARSRPTEETHELRTALTVVLARVQIARRQLKRGNHAAIDGHLAEAERHAKRAVDATGLH